MTEKKSNTLKRLATNAHFFLSIIVVIWHFNDPPSMPAQWTLGTMVGTFLLAIGIPPFGMLKPDELVGQDKKTLARHGFHESVAKIEKKEETEKTKVEKKST